MVGQSGEVNRGNVARSDASLSDLGRGVLQFWAQTGQRDAGISSSAETDDRSGWELHWSLTGQVMPSSPAIAKRTEEDGIPRIVFMPDRPWTDREYDNRHPRPVELDEQKVPTPDGGEVLAQWILEKLQDDPEAA